MEWTEFKHKGRIMFPSLPERYREEQVFIREILFEPTDLSARLVYADWLDEHGDPRAQLLRIDVELQQLPSNAPQRALLLHKRSQLLPKLDSQWLSLLALAAIERCPGSLRRVNWVKAKNGIEPERVEFQYRCPKRWENLKPGDEAEHIRFCTECERNVIYCYTIEAAHSHSQHGHCVAIDPSVPRRPYDIDYIHESELDIQVGFIRRSDSE